MIFKSIPRGVIYHSVLQDIIWLLKAFFTKLVDKEKIKEFEGVFAKSLGAKHCVSFPYARTAIYYALKSQNLPDGAEVLMPPITIKGVLDVVINLNLKPVFVDINSKTLCFDEACISDAITANTKVAIVTYLFGIVPNILSIVDLLKAKNIFVIEDFSQCLYGEFNNKYVGTFGDVGIYSASSIKTLDTYGGGFLVCNDDSINDYCIQSQLSLSAPVRKSLVGKIFTDLVRNIATTRFVFHVIVFPILKLVNQFNPQSAIKHIGDRDKSMIDDLPSLWFSAFTSFQAEIGLKLIRKVKNENCLRVANVERIKNAVNSAIFPGVVDGAKNIYWQLVADFDDPLQAQKIFLKNKVDTSTTSLVLISSLPDYPCQAETPNARRLYNNGLFIPSYPSLDDRDIRRVCMTVNKALNT